MAPILQAIGLKGAAAQGAGATAAQGAAQGAAAQAAAKEGFGQTLLNMLAQSDPEVAQFRSGLSLLQGQPTQGQPVPTGVPTAPTLQGLGPGGKPGPMQQLLGLPSAESFGQPSAPKVKPLNVNDILNVLERT